MSVCDHDPHCPGYGFAHEAGLSPQERSVFGVPTGTDLSRKKVKRLIRATRKQLRDADQ